MIQSSFRSPGPGSHAYLIHLLLDLGVLCALPVAPPADVLVAVLVHLVVHIVALVVSARLILSLCKL